MKNLLKIGIKNVTFKFCLCYDLHNSSNFSID